MTFTRLFTLLLTCTLCALASACHPLRTPPPAEPLPLLILVSIDGFRADYLQPELTPTLVALGEDGVRARAMRPSFPSLTFPNHYTLVTGRVPDHHGIVANTMVDPQLKGTFALNRREAVSDPAWWNDAQPIWNTAGKAGLRTATMFWPGSEAPIHGLHPDHWLPFDMSMTPQSRVAQVLDWLDLPAGERPDFVTLYFDAVDHAGHVTGPDSDEVRHALRETDAAIAQLVEGLKARGRWERTNLVIVSDHGMVATPPEKAVTLDTHAPPGSLEFITQGPLAMLRARPGHEQDVDLALSRPIPHIQCWRKGELPARFQFGSHRRVTPWVCMGEEGWTIYDSRHLKRFGLNPGAHGFDPALDSMAALFLARGPDFGHGLVVEGFDNVDLYPLLARLLRIVPEANDGDPASTLPLMRQGADFQPRQY